MQLSREAQQAVDDIVKADGYGSPSDVVEDAIRIFRQWRELRTARLRAEVQIGEDAFARGEFSPWSEVKGRLLAQLVEMEAKAAGS